MTASHTAAPHTAMVLAAGLGLRMRPLTLDRPKPLIPVAGRAMLDHALDRLAEAGVATAVVNTHYKGAMIAEHLRGRTAPRILLSPEGDLLETGGGIRHALPLLGPDPILTVNADMLWLDGPRPAVARLADAFDADAMDALLLLMPTAGSIGYAGSGDFHLDPAGRLTRRTADATAPFVYAGVQIVKPGLFAENMPDAFSTNLIWDRVQARGRLFGLRHDGLWFHIGTPEALAETEAYLQANPPMRPER